MTGLLALMSVPYHEAGVLCVAQHALLHQPVTILLEISLESNFLTLAGPDTHVLGGSHRSQVLAQSPFPSPPLLLPSPVLLLLSHGARMHREPRCYAMYPRLIGHWANASSLDLVSLTLERNFGPKLDAPRHSDLIALLKVFSKSSPSTDNIKTRSFVYPLMIVPELLQVEFFRYDSYVGAGVDSQVHHVII
ncbi:hypothetical protein C8J57DRAFT_1544447 [Mycena rebaudengoi]|nr:hypothetical protein C8J57DRAFT_1544447 [Mycena rebaudengoi]